MAERIDELQQLVDEGGDITAKNGLGQTMYEVATEKQKWRSGARRFYPFVYNQASDPLKREVRLAWVLNHGGFN